MSKSREQIDRILDAVRNAVVPVVERVLQDDQGGFWAESIAAKFRLRRSGRGVEWDTGAVLKCIADWFPVFRRIARVDDLARPLADELRSYRNKSAHHSDSSPLGPEDVRRVLDTAERFLRTMHVTADLRGTGPSPVLTMRPFAPDSSSELPDRKRPRHASTPARTDRERFFEAIEQVLAPPTTKNGPVRNPGASWRSGAFASRVILGVDALEDGTMRVHLLSDHDSGKRILRGLERKQRADALRKVPDGLTPEIRTGAEGNRVYFGFQWRRKGGYGSEMERTRSLVEWFTSIRPELVSSGA
jgi:hypothetical protein